MVTEAGHSASGWVFSVTLSHARRVLRAASRAFAGSSQELPCPRHGLASSGDQRTASGWPPGPPWVPLSCGRTPGPQHTRGREPGPRPSRTEPRFSFVAASHWAARPFPCPLVRGCLCFPPAGQAERLVLLVPCGLLSAPVSPWDLSGDLPAGPGRQWGAQPSCPPPHQPGHFLPPAGCGPGGPGPAALLALLPATRGRPQTR